MSQPPQDRLRLLRAQHEVQRLRDGCLEERRETPHKTRGHRVEGEYVLLEWVYGSCGCDLVCRGSELAGDRSRFHGAHSVLCRVIDSCRSPVTGYRDLLEFGKVWPFA